MTVRRFFACLVCLWVGSLSAHTTRDFADQGLFAPLQNGQDISYFQYSTSVVGPFPPVNPALSLIVPASRALSYIEHALARLTPDDLGTFGVVQTFVWPRSRFTRPLLRVANEDMVVGVGLLRSSSDPVALERMVAGNRVLYEEARAIGGALYPFSALKLTRDDWRLHYGSAWRALARAKRRYDPHNVMASGPDLFGRPQRDTDDHARADER